MRLCKAKGVLVVPFWPSAAYWPLLIRDYRHNIKDFIKVKGNKVLRHGFNTNSLLGSNEFQGYMLALLIDLFEPIWINNNSSVLNAIIDNIWDGREDSTVHKYCLSLWHYLSFCRENDYSLALPFNSTILAEYLTLQKIGKSKASIEKTIVALKWIHGPVSMSGIIQ